MKNVLQILAVICLLSLAGVAQAAPKPNILFIFADDMSYETVGAYGMLDIDTPHLDTLVERGITFSHAYNMGSWSGAVCVASRAMLNTGRFVWRAKQTNVKEFAEENRMWSQRMQKAGYRTFMTGKWHVHVDAESIFDVAQNVRGGMPKQVPEGYDRPKDEADYATGWKPWDPKHGGFWEGGTHWSEVVANDGIKFLEQAAKDDKPFFMYIAFNAPHDPRQAPKEYIDRYPLDRIKLPENYLEEYPYAEAICGKRLRDERLIPYPRTEFAVKVNRQEYFALITHMDDQIGRVLEALEKTGQADNTYIVFTADHGLAVGRHGLVGKQNLYDHSVRVPFLVVGPDVKAGATIDAPIYLQDVMPTSLELAGTNLDGVEFESLLPLLSGQKKTSYGEVYGAYLNRQRMIIKDDWKFLWYPTAGVERLFNLKKDPFEKNDLASNPEQAPRLRRMRAALAKLSEDMDDPGVGEKKAPAPAAKKKAVRKPKAGVAAETTLGPWAIEPNPKLPNVLILGDSISIGYTLQVRELLKGKANVFRPHVPGGKRPMNCAGTTSGVQKIDDYLAAQKKWDVIHFNWGLHDLKHVHPKTGQNSNSFDDPQQAAPDAYEKNLKEIVGKLKATGAKLIFATTTPYPDGVKPARLPADAKRYNDIALKIMKANGVAVNDLYSAVLPKLDKLQKPVNVHFSNEGSAFLAERVARAITPALP